MNTAEVDLSDFDTVHPSLPVVVLPVNVPVSGVPVRVRIAGLVARAAAWTVSMHRPLRYRVEEVYEAGPGGKDMSRIEVEPLVLLEELPHATPFAFEARIERLAGESSLILQCLGCRLEVFFKGRGDTVPLKHPSLLR